MVRRPPGRHPLSLGVFVEGRSDREAIPILLRKLGETIGTVEPVKAGKMFDADYMSRRIEEMTRRHRRLSRILIFPDSECTDPQETLQRATPSAAELQRRLKRPPIDYVVVDHSLEGWLLCDVGAVRSVLGVRARVTLRENPEDDCRPAELLRRIFRRNGRDFNKVVHNPRIAEQANPQAIAQKSPTFQRLLELLAATPPLDRGPYRPWGERAL